MAKEALLFPGQGLEPKDIISFHSKLKTINEIQTYKTLSLAQDALNETFGYKMFQINSALRNEEHPVYRQTAFMQPLIYSLSVVSFDVAGGNLDPSFVAGHSLGEYSALTIANVMTPEQGLQIVAQRGKLMQEACEEKDTRLISIYGLSEETVRNVFDEELVQVALVNSPDITVVGCPSEKIEEVTEYARQIGAARCSVLDTQGAFHTTYMTNAARYLTVYKYEFNQPSIPVVANTTGHTETNLDFLINGLWEGMILPVQWAETIRTLINEGVTDFIEVGPGNSIAILNRKNGLDRSQTRNILD